MTRALVGALPSALLLLATGAAAPAAAQGLDRPAAIEIRTACDESGRCYETGDPGFRDDDVPPTPRRRYEDDDDRPHRAPHRDDPYSLDRAPPPPPPRGYERYDREDDAPPPRRRTYRDDDD